MPVTESEIYKEQYAHFRSMNEILYKIPPIFTAVIGALWYFAATAKDPWLAAAVFVYAAIMSLLFIGVMERFRGPFNDYIDNINKFDGEHKVSAKKADGSSRTFWCSTVKLIQSMSALACLLSLAGIFYFGPYTIYLDRRLPFAVCPEPSKPAGIFR